MKMTADTPEEFLALLRDILDWSGLTAGQVAASSKIPRSTCYHFVDRNNTALPKSREQVEKFARGCRLNTFHIAQVTKLWDKLHNGPGASVADPPQVYQVDDSRKAEILQVTDLVDVITDRPAPASGTEAWMRVTADPVRGTRRDLYLVAHTKPPRANPRPPRPPEP